MARCLNPLDLIVCFCEMALNYDARLGREFAKRSEKFVRTSRHKSWRNNRLNETRVRRTVRYQRLTARDERASGVHRRLGRGLDIGRPARYVHVKLADKRPHTGVLEDFRENETGNRRQRSDEAIGSSSPTSSVL